MLIIDILILLLSLLCLIFVTRIWQLVGGKGRIAIIGAFLYASIVRIFVIVNDLIKSSIPTAQMTIGFYILMAIGLGMLLWEIKGTLRVKK